MNGGAAIPGALARPASREWEFVPLSPEGLFGAWAWFQPQGMPLGVSLSVPPETLRAMIVTPRTLLAAIGVAPAHVAALSQYGGSVTSFAPQDPAWNVPLGEPPPGVDPQLHVWLHPPAMAAPVAKAPVSIAATRPSAGGGALEPTFARMEADWHAITHVERQLETLRRQLADMLGKLGALNRDLSPEERLYADRQDQTEWQDARRWLRDCASKVQQCLKAQNVGDASDAGRRQWFEQIYETHVAPRRPFEGLDAAQREFEQHRKLVQTLAMQMNSALGRAAQEGEQRARRILAKITAKSRARRPGQK